MTKLPIRIITSKYLLWSLLALPAWPFLTEFVAPDHYYPELMHRSGELSAQLLVFTLLITPLVTLLKQYDGAVSVARWLLRNRRAFGVAAFGYAAVHTLLYLRQIGFDWGLAWLEALDWPFGSGWLAFLVLSVLAVTSNNWAVAILGKYWKPLQRFVYFATAATFLHWVLLEFFIDDSIFWLIFLIIGRILHFFTRISIKTQ